MLKGLAFLSFAVAVGIHVSAPARAEPPRPAPPIASSRATPWLEEAIGSQPTLAADDTRLAVIYAEALRERSPEAASLASEQADWLARRETCRTAANPMFCLLDRYDERKKALLVSLPVLARLRRPVSAAEADGAIAVLRRLEPGELSDVTTADNRDALSDVSCRFFARFPEEAAAVQASVGSARDGWAAL